MYVHSHTHAHILVEIIIAQDKILTRVMFGKTVQNLYNGEYHMRGYIYNSARILFMW